MRISTKLAFVYSLSVVTAILLTALLLLGEVRRETASQANLAQEGRIKTFWALLKTKGDEFRVENDKLYVGDYLINGNYELGGPFGLVSSQSGNVSHKAISFRDGDDRFSRREMMNCHP